MYRITSFVPFASIGADIDIGSISQCFNFLNAVMNLVRYNGPFVMEHVAENVNIPMIKTF